MGSLKKISYPIGHISLDLMLCREMIRPWFTLVASLFLVVISINFNFVNAFDWQSGTNGQVRWAHNCDFQGNDIASQGSSGEDCGGLCVSNQQCTHFTHWNGVCYIKKAYYPTAVDLNGGTCGWVDHRNGDSGGGGGNQQQQQVLGSRLSVNGNQFTSNGRNVFLSGVNFAWSNYGNDFGNNNYGSGSQGVFGGWLREVASAGGNTVRVWVHVEGQFTPNYDGNGYVLGTDRENSLASDMKSFLDSAQSQNVMVIFVSWNGASVDKGIQNTINLFWDTGKLQSYINNALKPMVSSLKGHPALAAWEIINEPEGLVNSNNYNGNNCFNTVPIAGSGAGWTYKYIPMQNIQRFINWQAAAIHQTDPGALVTVGSWSERAITDNHSDSRNYFSDACLIAAGGQGQGTLDFFQVHTYAYKNQYSYYSPFKVSASSYGLDKPLIIGEFSSSCSDGMSIQQQYANAINNGYQGALSWQYVGGYCADGSGTLDQGMQQIRNQIYG